MTGTIGTVKRPDGSTQVTYNGHPLYYYAPDSSAGQARGQGIDGVWFAQTPNGAVDLRVGLDDVDDFRRLLVLSRDGNTTVTHLASARARRRAESERAVEAADEAGLNAAFVTYGGELFGFARRSLGDNGLAEEAVQETFMRAWRSRHRFDPSLGSLRSWLFAIETASGDRPRPQAVVERHRSACARSGRVDSQAEQAMLGWQVEEALRRLRPEHRSVVQDIYFQKPAGPRGRRPPGGSRGNGEEPPFLRPEVASAGPRGDGVGAMSTLSCEKARGQLALASIGRLPESERLSLESHLDGCEDCRNELDGLSGLELCARRSRSRPGRPGAGGPGVAPLGGPRLARNRGRQAPPLDAHAGSPRPPPSCCSPWAEGRRDSVRGRIAALAV